MSEVEKTIAAGSALGVIGFVALVAAVFATGSTFGQRCSQNFDTGTAEWNECVKTLSDGSLPTPSMTIGREDANA